MQASPRRVLITGGSGFLGAHLVRDLVSSGDDVHLLLRPGSKAPRLTGLVEHCTVHSGDLCDATAVRAAVTRCRPEGVYHLATYGVHPGQSERSIAFNTNLGGMANLLNALDDQRYQFLVNAGTCWEYGHREGPIQEEDASFSPRTDYAVSKLAATLLCQAEAHTGRPVTTVRIFSAYGQGEEPARLVPYVMACCLKGEPPRVSAGLQVRDFIHVDDVVALLRIAAERPEARGRILHAGSGRGHSVRDMIETIVSVGAGGRVKPAYGAASMRAAEPDVCVASIERTTALTGWKPRYDLRAGVERTWDCFRGAADRAA